MLSTWVSTTIFFLLTITPTPAPSEQGKTFTTPDKSFSFVYPANWFVSVVNPDQGSNASVSIVNAAGQRDLFLPEAVNIQVSLPKHSFEIFSGNAKSPKEAIAQSAQITVPATIAFETPSADATPSPLQLQLGVPDVEEFTVNGRPAAYAYESMQVAGMNTGTLLIMADLGNDYWVSINATSYAGGLNTLQENQSAILAIVQTMIYIPSASTYSGNADLPQVYSGLVGIWKRGSIKFFYPQDWYVSTPITGIVLVSNKKGNVFNVQPVPGQFIAIVQGVSETRSMVDQTELFNQCNTAKSDLTAKTLVQKLLSAITSTQLNQMKQAGITISNPEVTSSGNNNIVYFYTDQKDMESLEIFIDMGDGNISLMVVTAQKSDTAAFMKQLLAVAGTFEYTPNPCSSTMTPTPSR